MKQRTKERIYGLILLKLGLILLIVFPHTIYKMYQLPPPDPYEIDVSYFKGRILPAAEVNPGTFTIRKPFEEINGENAILTFEKVNTDNSEGNSEAVKLRAWEPDPVTEGVKWYGEKEIPIPIWQNEPTEITIGVISESAGRLRVTPCRALVPGIFFTVVYFVAGVVVLGMGMHQIVKKN